MKTGAFEKFRFIGISELQKISSSRLTKLTDKPLVVSDKNRPKFVILKRTDYEELATPELPYEFLVARPHPWKKQLWVKGKNVRAFHVISFLKSNRLTPEEAAGEMGLPNKAVYECLHYYENNKALIEMEALEEKRYLQEVGFEIPVLSF